MPATLVTIGIPCFNAAETIRRAIDSALAQDWPSFEVLVVDDCSTDNSIEIIAEAIVDKPFVRLIRHERNAGVAAARNTIVDNARGEFIAFFDDDDDSRFDRLRRQVRRIIEYEQSTGAELIFCYANRKVITPDGNVLASQGEAIGRAEPEPHGPPVADYVLKVRAAPEFVWGMLGSCTLTARRQSFQAVGQFDELFRRCAEWDMAVRGALMGAHFIAVNRPLITQYLTETVDKSGDIPLRYALLLHEKYRNYLRSQKAYRASRLLVRANYHGFRRQYSKYYGYRLLAMMISPALLADRMRARRFARSGSKKA
jgi:glycosyltransferase involved in cell wall biosynthesis